MPRPPALAAALLVVVVAAVVLISAPLAWTRTAVDGGGGGDAPPEAVEVPAAPPASAPPTTEAADGLHPGLVTALRAAVAAADQAGHDLSVTSGYRTVAEQEELLAEAIAERGPREALRWVFPPDRSMHVRGLAVDVGDRAAARWLDRYGARFGLCRTLDWEWWHFEWREGWEAASSCPGPVDDPEDAPT